MAMISPIAIQNLGVCLFFQSIKYHINVSLPRFSMLKAWIANPDLGAIEITESNVKYAEEMRKDKYVTASCLYIVLYIVVFGQLIII